MSKFLATHIAFMVMNSAVYCQKIRLKDVVSDQEVTFPDFKSKKFLVVVFTSNYCPYAKLYENRVLKLHKKYAENLSLVLINPNNPNTWNAESETNMKAIAQSGSYPFPYLSDKRQLAVKLLRASKTPEAFLLKAKGTSFEVVYKGAIDDNPQSEENVKIAYLDLAIANAFVGNSTKSEWPTGCRIKE